MYASIPDALRALARKIGADANGRNEEEILNNIVVKLGGTPIRNHGVAGSIDAMTKVVDLDVMHNMTTLNVTPTSEAQTIIPESPVDGYSQVSVSAVTAAIDSNITAENIKNGVTILGVEGSMVSGTEFSATPSEFTLMSNISNLNVVIPNGVTTIGNNAFYRCVGLKSVEIPSSVTIIGLDAFQFCTGLTDVVISNGVTTIGNSAFDTCTELTSVEIPSSVTSIGTAAFYKCVRLTSVEIPGSVNSIGSNAFADCTNLTTITVHKAEGSITGAPWGAPNATVVWDG